MWKIQIPGPTPRDSHLISLNRVLEFPLLISNSGDSNLPGIRNQSLLECWLECQFFEIHNTIYYNVLYTLVTLVCFNFILMTQWNFLKETRILKKSGSYSYMVGSGERGGSCQSIKPFQPSSSNHNSSESILHREIKGPCRGKVERLCCCNSGAEVLGYKWFLTVGLGDPLRRNVNTDVRPFIPTM